MGMHYFADNRLSAVRCTIRFTLIVSLLVSVSSVAADNTPLSEEMQIAVILVTPAENKQFTAEQREIIKRDVSDGGNRIAIWVVDLDRNIPIPLSGRAPPIHSDPVPPASSVDQLINYTMTGSVLLMTGGLLLYLVKRVQAKINGNVADHIDHKLSSTGVSKVNMKQVFLSYATENRDIVETYRSELKKLGIDAWIDHQKIKGGQSIVESLNSAINECQIALLFYSEAYLRSPWTNAEQRALLYMFIESNRDSEENRQLLVIKLDDSPLPPMLAHQLWMSNPSECAQSVASLMGLGIEAGNVSSEKVVSGIPSELDAITIESFASQLMTQIRTYSPRRTGLRVVLTRFGELSVDCLPYTSGDDMLFDGIKNCLEICSIHRRHIGAYQKRLANCGLGVFDEAFRIALDEKIELLNAARFGSSRNPGLRELLDGLILKVRQV